MQQIEFFVNMSELEQRVQLNQLLPCKESYQRRRMGTSAVGVCLAIHEYAFTHLCEKFSTLFTRMR